MKRFLVFVAILTPLVASGCSDSQVVAEAAITFENTGEPLALRDLPIRLLPYDRDAIFDSLEAAYGVPQPPIPPEVLEQQQEVQDAQVRYRAVEDQWAVANDSVESVTTQLTKMQNDGLRDTPEYAQLFRHFNALEDSAAVLKVQMDSAFAEFDELQQATLVVTDSLRAVRDAWAEEAFRDFNTVIEQKLEESGREALADTTSTDGIASFSAPEGTWWIYSRYTLPFEELYWNIPIEVTGDSMFIRLNRENAEIRPVM